MNWHQCWMICTGKNGGKKEQHVLPKSEPRKRLPNLNNGHISNTERKPKFSALYKNPYLETEKLKSDSLLKALHTSRLKNYMESPVIKRINDYCDSDTDSSKQNCPRRKLDFNNSFTYDEEIIGKNQAITSKYFKDHVESKNAVPKKSILRQK
ncbi:hypothetical protein NQ315_004850 [Exocentrus adspersus]|uniref:Uncharacterized protein n=1 Tax=Exocentrus adspersus TaxID=1586481 RepID=A0AAV8W436_9CUCU|nr:hypothetical protein NQ315_004850 [Exocentrus adspersus]